VAGHGQRSFDEGNMKHYTGVRTESGCIVCVTEIRDPAMTTRPLDPRHDLRNHSPDGFEWGYGGSGPAQLALAILADYTGDDEQALRLYQSFKHRVIGRFDGDLFALRDQQIDAFLRRIRAEMGAAA
jgi:hypothetical protein